MPGFIPRKVGGLLVLMAALLTCGAILTSCRDDNPDKTKGIVILFETDVHCSIDGYAQLAGLRYTVNVADHSVTLYRDAFVQYVTEALGGHIGQPYAEPQGLSE